MLMVFFAGLFHHTAWLWFVVLLLLRIPRRKTFVGITLVSTAICFLSSRYVVTTIAAFFPRYQLYFGSSYLKSGAKLSLFLYFAVFSLMLLVGEITYSEENIKDRDRKDEWDFRISFLLLIVCILGYNAPIFSRLLQFFQLNLCVYFSNRLYYMPVRTRRIILLSSILAFAVYDCTIHLLRTPEWYTTYPYVFCWDH